eukprot:1140617-Amphidinium_carterae.1
MGEVEEALVLSGFTMPGLVSDLRCDLDQDGGWVLLHSWGLEGTEGQVAQLHDLVVKAEVRLPEELRRFATRSDMELWAKGDSLRE